MYFIIYRPQFGACKAPSSPRHCESVRFGVILGGWLRLIVVQEDSMYAYLSVVYTYAIYIYIYLSLSPSLSLSLHRLLEEFSQAKGVDIRIYIYLFIYSFLHFF